jgi:hypothetical protein
VGRGRRLKSVDAAKLRPRPRIRNAVKQWNGLNLSGGVHVVLPFAKHSWPSASGLRLNAFGDDVLEIAEVGALVQESVSPRFHAYPALLCVRLAGKHHG